MEGRKPRGEEKAGRCRKMGEVLVLEAEVEWGEKAEIKGEGWLLSLRVNIVLGRGSLGQGSGNMQTSLETSLRSGQLQGMGKGWEEHGAEKTPITTSTEAIVETRRAESCLRDPDIRVETQHAAVGG